MNRTGMNRQSTPNTHHFISPNHWLQLPPLHNPSCHGPFTLPGEDMCMCLMRYFTPFFTCALEALYLHKQHAKQWAAKNALPAGINCQSFWVVGDRHVDQMR